MWERNAADDTFGFGVVFSDETLGGIAHADPVIHDQMEREFARWDDIDVHYRGEVVTSGGHGFAALGRKRLLEILQQSVRGPRGRRAVQLDGPGRRAALRRLRPRGRGGRPQLAGAHQVRRPVPADARRAALPLHVARHRQGLRGLHLRHPRDTPRRHADARLPVRRPRQHLHRRDARRRVAASGIRPGPGARPRTGRVRRGLRRGRARALRACARRPRGPGEQLTLGQLHHRPQRALVPRQHRAARRRRPHRALLHRLRHQAGHGGRARPWPPACTSRPT